ncbi:hypothetical protein ABIC83_002378 [Roseateles asaccharophilus]|uniref:hypothetical protein n=1 Tax=Roseateles asaccharophilus TaxID=582607 RepID=UPI003838E0EB
MPTSPASTQPLYLFTVTLDWLGHGTGDYSDKVWAATSGEAVASLAAEMSEHPDAECESEDEEIKYAQKVIQLAGPHAAVKVADKVLADIRELLAGPDGKISDEAVADYNAMAKVLEKCGAFNPWPEKAPEPAAQVRRAKP